MTLIAAVLLSQKVVTYDLSEGFKVSYEVERTFRTLDGLESTTYLEDWTFSHQEKLAGGAAVLKVERTLNGMIVDGSKIAITPSTFVGSEHRSPRGDVRNRAPSDQLEPAFELRLLRIADIEYPATTLTPGSWTKETKPTIDGLPAATWTWTIKEIAEKTHGTFVFEEKDIENPVRAEGAFVLTGTSAWPLQLSFKAINTHQPGDEEALPTVYAFSMKRK